MDKLGILSKGFSYGLLAKILLLIFIGGTISAFALYVFIEETVSNDYSNVLLSLKNLENVLLRKTLLVYAITGALILGAIALLNLFYSHRVAGPLFRFGREATKIGAGDLTVRVTLRPTDVVVPLAEDITALASRYRERVVHLQGLSRECESLSTNSVSLIEKGADSKTIEASVDAIKGKLNELETLMKEIRL